MLNLEVLKLTHQRDTNDSFNKRFSSLSAFVDSCSKMATLFHNTCFTNSRSSAQNLLNERGSCERDMVDMLAASCEAGSHKTSSSSLAYLSSFFFVLPSLDSLRQCNPLWDAKHTTQDSKSWAL